MREERAILSFCNIPNLKTFECSLVESVEHKPLWKGAQFSCSIGGGGYNGSFGNFASVSMEEKRDGNEFAPRTVQLLKHPLAILAYVPRDAAIFAAGAIAGAAAKTVTAPLDRIKLLMQVIVSLFDFHFAAFFPVVNLTWMQTQSILELGSAHAFCCSAIT